MGRLKLAAVPVPLALPAEPVPAIVVTTPELFSVEPAPVLEDTEELELVTVSESELLQPTVKKIID